MSKKKWHDDIREKGVLCKTNGQEDICLIMRNHHHDNMVIDKIGRVFGVDELTPLAAAEIWGFMPWQDMKDAPIDEPFILVSSGVFQDAMFAVSDCGILYTYLDGDVYDKYTELDKWIPLPQVSK